MAERKVTMRVAWKEVMMVVNSALTLVVVKERLSVGKKVVWWDSVLVAKKVCCLVDRTALQKAAWRALKTAD